MAETVSVEERPDGIRLTLPRRTLPAPLRNVGFGALIVGSVMLANAGRLLWQKGPSGEPAATMVWAVFSVLPLVLAALLLLSRTVVSVKGGRLVVSEAVGFFAWRRAFPLADVRALKVELLPFKASAQPVPAMGILPENGVTIVSGAVGKSGRHVLLFGYPKTVLQHAAAEINKRAIVAAAKRAIEVDA